MNQRTATRLAAGLWVFMMVLTLVAAVIQIVTRDAETVATFAFRGFDMLLSVVVGSVGALIAARRHDNAIGWIMLVGGLASAVQFLGGQYAVLSSTRYDRSLPLTLELAWLQNWLWVPLTSAVGIFVPSLFPDGRPLSRGWGKFLTYFALVGLALFAAGNAATPGQLSGMESGFTNPFPSKAVSDALSAVGGLAFVTCLIATVVSVVKRYRRSVGIAREQMKWLVLSATGVGVTLGAASPVFLIYGEDATGPTGIYIKVMELAIVIAILGIPISTGIAVLRYRLYDIDVVINKAVVFTALTAGIAAAYVAVVFGVGAAVGSAGEPNVPLSVGATALVALAFQPLRAWARRVANRLVYGKRATPHDVLNVLGERIAEAYSLDDVLPRLARLVTEATAASSAEVWLRVGEELRPTAAWPHDPAPDAVMPVPAEGAEPAIAGAEHTFPVRHQGELLGTIAVRTPANETLTSADERLLADLASHAGLVLRNLRLIEELRASRQRLVSAQDVERRKIERNLHDGAQQHLVALSINLRLAQNLLDGDLAQAREILTQLQSDASDALENLRDLARGIYPPLLADRGLAAAVTSHASKAPVPTTVEAGTLGRYPMEVEAAIYFCVLEALQNVAKYAGASSAVVQLAESNGHLTFAVTDDGAGFDPARAARGAGLTNMTDRLEALGGRLEVTSKPGAGTTIRGWVASAPAAS